VGEISTRRRSSPQEETRRARPSDSVELVACAPLLRGGRQEA